MPSWADVVAMGRELAEVEESTWYRAPALKVAGKGFARLRTEAEGGLMLHCSVEEKQALLASGDPASYTTPHYAGYGAILVDLDRVDVTQLRELVEEAWRRKSPGLAPQRLNGSPVSSERHFQLNLLTESAVRSDMDTTVGARQGGQTSSKTVPMCSHAVGRVRRIHAATPSPARATARHSQGTIRVTSGIAAPGALGTNE
jgi:hypothetical protein